jgi:capsid protein
MGRNLLMWVGRVLYANSPAVAGIINEQAAMAAQNMQPVFDGEDKEWGEQAEEQLRLWHRIMCLEGPQYDRGTFLRTALISMVRDCDASYLLTSTSAGYPKVQALPAHRIDEPSHSVVVDGQWKGRTIIDGVIIDDYRRPLAYRVWDNNQTTFKDIAARHVGLWFDPTWQDQVRGFSKLAVGAFSFLDLKESRDFELLAQKVSATYTVLEQTETGQFDPSQGLLNTAATFSSTSGAESNLESTTEQLLEGGLIRRVKAGKGCQITAHNYDRPGANTQNYQADVMRDACMSLGWSYWFSVDPTKVGSGPFRVIVERINRWLNQTRVVLDAMCLHMDS